MNMKISLVGLAFALVALGCGMGDEDPPLPKTDSGPGTTETQTTPGKLQPPSVDPIPTSICSDTVPLQGTAPAGASVFVMGGLATSGIATDASPSSGRFCVDVPLKKGTVNTIEVRAQDPVLGISDATIVSVTHGGTCQDDAAPTPDPPKSRNVALGIQSRTSSGPAKGNPGTITDGSTSTWAQYDMGSGWNPIADASGWVTIKLEKLMAIEKIVVRWRDSSGSGDGYYGKKYKVLVSTKTDVGDPNVDNGYWTEVATISEGDGGVDTHDLKASKPLVQHVALWLQQDATSPVFDWSEHFAIAELEVWDVPATTTTTPKPTTTNTCASIGAK